MLLRSSSTPILGSLLPESPNNHHHHLPSFSCHLSPPSDSSPSSGLRRTRSDGNLHSLLPDEPHHSLKCPYSRRPNPVLEPIPSFFYGPNQTIVQDEEEEEVDEEEKKEKGEEVSFFEESEETRRSGAIGKQSALYLARGLGIDRLASGLMDVGCEGSGCGGGGSCGRVAVDGGGGEKSDTEMYYKRMMEDDPSNALVLRNYAQFLYEKKGDPQRAEEYYSRAILAGPGDGEILSQYAKLVWELHHDEERASTYFARAVEVAPQDSHVLAAYACFLWETEEDDERECGGNAQSKDNNGNPIHVGALASASA